MVLVLLGHRYHKAKVGVNQELNRLGIAMAGLEGHDSFLLGTEPGESPDFKKVTLQRTLIAGRNLSGDFELTHLRQFETENVINPYPQKLPPITTNDESTAEYITPAWRSAY